MRRPAVALAAVAAAAVPGAALCAVLCAAGTPHDVPPVVELQLPPEGSAWARVDLPPVHVGLAVRVTARGGPAAHLVLSRRPASVETLHERARELRGDGRVCVEVALPAPGEAPHRLLLPGAEGPAHVEVAAHDGAFRPLVEVDALTTLAGEPALDLPPLVGDRLRVTARGVGVVRAAWDGAADDDVAELEPVVAGRRLLSRAMEVLVDLRVPRAPGLRLELEVSGASAALPVILDAPASDWDPLPYMSGESVPGRLRGAVVAPGAAARRWLRVIVPSAQPDSIDVRVLHAAAARHRLFVRRDGAEPPFRLETRPVGAAPVDPPGPGLCASWDAGAPGGLLAPPFLEPRGYGRERPPPDAGRGGRPFPGAELVATGLLAALAIWAFLLRRGG